VGFGSRSRLDDLDVDRIRHLFEVNVVGSFVCAREAVAALVNCSGGR
jgi:short-subunit dehydrogenase